MPYDVLVWERVQRDGVTVAASFRRDPHLLRCRRKWCGEMLSGEQVACRTRTSRVRVAPEPIVPSADCAGFVQRRAHLRHHRGTVRLPRVLLLAHPLNANGAARKCAGE